MGLARWSYALLSSATAVALGFLIALVGWAWLNPIFPLDAFGGFWGAFLTLFTFTWWIYVSLFVLTVLTTLNAKKPHRVGVRVATSLLFTTILLGVAITLPYLQADLSEELALTVSVTYLVIGLYLIIGNALAALITFRWILPTSSGE